MMTFDIALRDLSPDWTGSTDSDKAIVAKLLKFEGSPKALAYFTQRHADLSDYWYWFLLSTLWVNYNGFTELATWRRLFTSTRPNRQTSMMKPSELKSFKQLPDTVTAYRAHRVGEEDWIAYTLNPERAIDFALRREVTEVMGYAIPRDAILALFLRRGESEVLVLDRSVARHTTTIDIAKKTAAP